MKANEFVKEFGLERVEQFVNADDTAHALVFATTGVSFIELKRLVESHDLVMMCGGLEAAKQNQLFLKTHELSKDGDHIDKAIADVESCL